MHRKRNFLVLLLISALPSVLMALVINLPAPGNDLIGEIRIVASQPKNNLHQIARQYEMGFDELVLINPKLKKYGAIPAYSPIIIPEFFILPKTPRNGITINLAEKRLYFYPKEQPVIFTEPVTIGRDGWPTPEIYTRIIEKLKDPVWEVPESIQQEQIDKGETPKTFVPAGPDNPLGQYALRLGEWSILIHGTNNPYSIGKRASHGCIRMYPEDISYLFELIPTGTPVRIVDQPFKLGWQNQKLYLEVHPSNLENRGTVQERVEQVYQMIMESVSSDKSKISWAAVRNALTREDGVPHVISK